MTNFDKYMETVDDRGDQGLFLKEFGSERVQNGICLSLAINWIATYLNHQNTKPNNIWHKMKNPETLRTIADKQEELAGRGIDVFLDKFGLITTGPCPFRKSDAVEILEECFKMSNQILIILEFDKDSHAISLIKHEEKVYLYDPNIGVINANAISNNIQRLDIASYQNLLTMIYHFYEFDLEWDIKSMTAYIVKKQ